MKVRILRVETDELVDASIRPQKLRLPGVADGWRFSFDKLSRKLPYITTYVLVTEETPDIIEGCMIFQLKDKVVPYMAYLEVAPHNYGKHKQYDYVAGCLIAFAFQQTYIQATGDYRALLYFEVSEKKPGDQEILVTLYSRNYGAEKVIEGLMCIRDEAGEALVKKYLDNGEAPLGDK